MDLILLLTGILLTVVALINLLIQWKPELFEKKDVITSDLQIHMNWVAAILGVTAIVTSLKRKIK